MNPDRNLPPDLDARLRDEPDADDLAAMWDLLGEARPAEATSDTDAAWDRLRAATLDAPRLASDRPAVRSRRRSRWVWAPVIATALVAVAGWIYVAVPVSVTAPAGAFVTVALPDGSDVELNSGSALSYARGFWRLPFVAADERTVQLSGEAYFDVERGARPFVVETADARVRVLGTAFNVRSRDDAGTIVTVEEGRVEVLGATEAVVLGAGQRSRVVGGTPSAPEEAAVTQAMVWRERGFAVQEQPLGAILRELERRYALDIDLRATDAAGDTLTLYFSGPTTAEAILRDLCTARDLRFRRTSTGFEVY